LTRRPCFNRPYGDMMRIALCPLAPIRLGVHFPFVGSAVAAIAGFGVPFVLALGVRMSARA
jgi:hypothetical protein